MHRLINSLLTKAMTPLGHVALFLAFLITTGLPRLVLRGYYARDLQKTISRASESRAVEIQSGWKSRQYEQFSERTDEKLLELIRKGELSLSEIQRLKLEKKVRELFHYLRQPTFDDYYALKTAGLRYRFEPAGASSNLLAEAIEQSGQSSNITAKQASRLIWDKINQRGGNSNSSRVTAVALASVLAAVTHTNSGRALLSGPVKQGLTVAVELANPGFTYSSGDASTAPVLFEFSFLAKVENPLVAGPIHISLIWIGQDQEWALNRLIADNWLHFRGLF